MSTFSALLLPTILHTKDSHVPSWFDEPIEFKDTVEGWIAISGVLAATYTNTQPVSENPTTYAATRLPGFSDDFYNRIICTPSNLAIGNVISSQVRTVDVFNGYFVDKELTSLTLTNGSGIIVSGPSAPSDWKPLQTQQYSISVSVDGPANINALLNFDWTGASDYSLPITGIRTVAFPYQAQTPWSEILEWKTNVLISNNGSEQRIRVRNAPRQSFSAVYPIQNSEIARSVNIVYSWLARRWAVPVWSETQVIASISIGATVITCDTVNYDIRAGSLIGIWKTATQNEILEIASLTSTTITLTTTVQFAYIDALLYPVRIGRVTNNGVARNSNGYNASLELTYDIFDNKTLPVSAPTQYLGYDLYTDETVLDSSNQVDDSFVTRSEIIDFGLGLVEQYSPWQYNRIARTYRVVKQGPEEIWAMKLWLHRRAGKLRPFWLPTFENNFRLNHTGLVNNTIRVWADEYRTLGSAHNHIIFKLKDGSWVPRQVTGTSIVDGVTLDVAFNGTVLNIDVSEIMVVSFLSLKRLDTDRIEIEHIGNNTASYAFRIIEILP